VFVINLSNYIKVNGEDISSEMPYLQLFIKYAKDQPTLSHVIHQNASEPNTYYFLKLEFINKIVQTKGTAFKFLMTDFSESIPLDQYIGFIKQKTIPISCSGDMFFHDYILHILSSLTLPPTYWTELDSLWSNAKSDDDFKSISGLFEITSPVILYRNLKLETMDKIYQATLDGISHQLNLPPKTFKDFFFSQLKLVECWSQSVLSHLSEPKMASAA
jgi:hypothetical protein